MNSYEIMTQHPILITRYYNNDIIITVRYYNNCNCETTKKKQYLSA